MAEITSSFKILRYLIRDLLNAVSERTLNTPRAAQLIRVRTASIEHVLPQLTDELDRAILPRSFTPRYKYTGRIIDGPWDLNVEPLTSLQKFRCCFQHFVDGQPWEETDLYLKHLARLMEDGTHPKGNSQELIFNRYLLLDNLYASALKQGHLATRHQLFPHAFREDGGIYVHISRNGTPIFGGGGIHRLAIAKILKLPEIPAQLGVTHRIFWEKYKRIPGVLG